MKTSPPEIVWQSTPISLLRTDSHIAALQGASNPRAIHSSKAVGEPPLFLAASAFFAIKDAIASARHDAGHDEHFVLDSPATPERIRMACTDDLTKPFAPPDLRPKLSV
jgi:xanthine dehydrogenase/oxidase